MTIRWKLEPKATGLRSIFAGPRGSDLLDSRGNILMTTSCSRDAGVRGPVEGWYWYGMGQNTCNNPLCATEKEARKEARAYYDSVPK